MFETSIRTTTEQRLVDNDFEHTSDKATIEMESPHAGKAEMSSGLFLKSLSFVLFYFHNMLDSVQCCIKCHADM